MHCQGNSYHFEQITHLIGPPYSHMFQESRLSSWECSILNCLPLHGRIFKLYFADIDAYIDLKIFCCMSEQNVESIHFMNTTNVAITVKTKTLFFEALNLRIRPSLKPAFGLHVVVYSVVNLVVFILFNGEFIIKKPRRTDKSSIFSKTFLTKILLFYHIFQKHYL